jgi:hypothetical protein
MSCQQIAMYRFTWPGQDEKCICLIHALTLINIAKALDLHLQLIQLSPEEMLCKSCSQKEDPNEIERLEERNE